jgi:hypothetical protein
MIVESTPRIGRLPFLIVLGLLCTSIAEFAISSNFSDADEPDALDDLESDFRMFGPRTSGTVVDVPSWRIGDRWTYAGEFDVAQLIASGGVNANVGLLTGTLNRNVQDIITMSIENRSTLVYEVRSVGTFGANGVQLDGYTGDLSIDYDSTDLIRVSDLANIRLSMSLDVVFSTFGGFINIDVADITIDTTYRPPQEGHDFPLSVGEWWNTSYTVSTEWSGSSDYFTLPEDSEDEGGNSWEVVASGNPGVAYSGCSNSYNITSYDENGTIVGFHWYCPMVENDAWQHFEQSLGLLIDFRLTAYVPVTRARTISVELESSAWSLDANLSAWLNVTDASSQPISGQTIQFRYEAESDFKSLTTAANGSAHVLFDSGNFTDPSPTSTDYASHGVAGWISGTKEVGVTTLTLDQNLLEVDLIAQEVGVTVSRTRGNETLVLNSAIGFDAIPNDDLTFSVPVVNRGLFASTTTELEITAPDGSTSRATVPTLRTFEEVRIVLAWSVPTDHPIGLVSTVFEVDPDMLEVRDGNRSNNDGVFDLFIGRLPVASIAPMAPFPTVTDVVINASSSYDPDGGDITCLFTVSTESGMEETRSEDDCTLDWSWMDDGQFTVLVAVIDDENDVATNSVDLTVLNRAPVVNVNSDLDELPVMSSVTFDATDHSDIDTISPEAPISILWDADCEEGRVTLECTVIPEIEGWYEIGLTATDDDGASTTATKGVIVTNIAPWGAEIFAYSNDTLLERNSQMVWHIEEDQVITLVGRANDSANDLADLRHLWQPDFDIDPSDARWLDGQQTSLEVAYGISGMHTVSLDVYDNDDASSGPEQAWFEVTNVAPWIEPFSELLPFAEDQIVEVTAVYGDTASDVDTLVRCWDLDLIVNSDETGSADDDCDIEGDTMANAWLRAETAPSQIAFHVMDDDGERTMAVLNLTIRNVRPKAVANVTSLTVEVGTPIHFNAEGTTDSSADIEVLTYRWDFNGHIDTDDDGFPANDIDSEGYAVSHIFSEPGTYLVRLTVKDEAAESTVDLQVVVSRSSSGFFGALDAAGGDDPTVVVGLGVVLLILLTVLGIGLLRKEDDSSGAGWQAAVTTAGGDIGAPSAPPPTYAFQEQPQSGPPIPAEGLPLGWTADQWSWYGEQWLVENSGGAGAVGAGKSRAGVLVTAAEPAGFTEPISDQQAADVFDGGYFASQSDSIDIPLAQSALEGATAVLLPADTNLPQPTQSEVSDSLNSVSESNNDPFGALDLDL